MPSETLILDIRRAQAEAASRVVRNWKPSEDFEARARVLELLAKEGLDSPRRLRELANDVIDNRPTDGTLLEYLNRQRETLMSCFEFTLDALRSTRDQALASRQTGHDVPSLPALEIAIEKAEQVQLETFEHWELFDEKPDLGPPEEWLTDEEAFKDIDARLSEELRRELQNRMDRAGS